MNESWHAHEWIMARIWMSHGTHMNESWYAYEWVMARIWMSHGTHMNESWHAYEWVINELFCASWMTHEYGRESITHDCHGNSFPRSTGLFRKRTLFFEGSFAKEAYRYTERIHHTWMSRRPLDFWMSHITRTDQTCHTYKYVKSHLERSHVTYVKELCQRNIHGTWHKPKLNKNGREIWGINS